MHFPGKFVYGISTIPYGTVRYGTVKEINRSISFIREFFHFLTKIRTYRYGIKFMSIKESTYVIFERIYKYDI